MKYEIIVKQTSEWAYTVEAHTPEGAKEILQDAIDGKHETDLSDFPCQIFDGGMLEIINDPELLD
jgi:hypothetical protein